MSKIREYISGSKTDGTLQCKVRTCEDIQKKGYFIQEMLVYDDTGEMKLTVFDYDKIFMAGDTLKCEGLYIKEYQGNKQLNLGKKGNILILESDQPSNIEKSETAISLLKQVLGYFDELADDKAIMEQISERHMNDRVVKLFTKAEEFIK